MKDFYMTLLSNSSMNYFPNNKTSVFTVHLPRKVILKENWAVALASINYRYNFFNVTEKNNRICINV